MKPRKAISGRSGGLGLRLRNCKGPRFREPLLSPFWAVLHNEGLFLPQLFCTKRRAEDELRRLTGAWGKRMRIAQVEIREVTKR